VLGQAKGKVILNSRANKGKRNEPGLGLAGCGPANCAANAKGKRRGPVLWFLCFEKMLEKHKNHKKGKKEQKHRKQN